MNSIVFLLIISATSIVNGSKILIVFPMPAKSHYILGNSLARTLAEAGHDITMVSPFEEKNPPKKGTYRDVSLTGFMETPDKKMPVNLFDMGSMNVFLNIPMMAYLGNMATTQTFEHPNFQKLINSDEHFDLVILEQFNNDAMKVLAYHYKAPLILFSTVSASGWINPLVGNPSPPSYIPDIFTSYTDHMTFWQRTINALFILGSELNRQFIFFPQQNKIMKKHFPNAPDLSILNYNASLVLMNAHQSISQPVPYVPSMIDIGGFHVDPPKELPKDLKEYMDSAKEGVVYFSMGSNIKPSQMSQEKKEAIMKVLGKLKQKVLWKWDEDNLPNKPDNVKLSKWFPQQDILAHPNVKVFITHGGLLSTTETVYHGVPVLALPIFGDQKLNAARAEINGVGISLSYSDITEKTFGEALDKLLNDKRYSENAKRRSSIMHDRPMKPKDVVVFWTEYVIRNKGAPHLRVAALDLPWYKYHLLDVVGFLVLISFSLVLGLYILVKRLCCSKSKIRSKVKKN